MDKACAGNGREVMLEPDYFTNKEDRLLEMYRKLEIFIMKDIARRLLNAGEMTATADRMMYKLEQMGESREAIEKKLSKLTGMTREELRALLQDAVLTSWSADTDVFNSLGIEVSNPLENAAVRRIMNAEWQKSTGELKNLTRTTMSQSQNDLIDMLDEADVQVASGTQSYNAAICKILDRYAGRGIIVDYPTGAKRTLEAAVRCCVVTSMNQTAAQVTNQYIVEGGIEYVLVSAHTGARLRGKNQPYLAGHADWQGRAYKIVGSEEGYPNLLESTGYDIDPVTGKGTVVNPLGLHGYNCRHGHQPWDKRLRNPYLDENGNLKISSAENRMRAGQQSKQRSMERDVRETKRRLMMKKLELETISEPDIRKTLQAEYDELSYKWTEQNKAYNEFCEQSGLKPQYERIKVASFTRTQEQAANEAAGRYTAAKKAAKSAQNSASDGEIKLNEAAKTGTIKEKVESGEYSLKLSRQMYLKHVEGTAQFKSYAATRAGKGLPQQSVITITEEEAQEIINSLSGKGVERPAKNGVSNVEFVFTDKVVGKCYDKGAWKETTKVAIHHGKRSSHIVPVKEKENV